MKNVRIKKFRNIITILTVAIIIFLSAGAVVRATEETVDITCVDTNLYQALKENIPSRYINSTSNDTNTIKIKVEAMPEITALNLSGNNTRKITNLSGIENFNYLTELDLNTNNISDISKIAQLSNLTNLNLSKNAITDITPLASNVNLKRLILNNNTISNIESICSLPLEELDVSSNSISTVENIQKLSGKLKILDISLNTGLSNINDVIVTSLEKLNVSNTAITSLAYSTNSSKLHNCRKLIDLRLANCKLIDSSLLFAKEDVLVEEDKTEKRAILRNIQILDLSGTGVSSFSNLKTITSLRELYLQNNGISNLSGIYELDSLEYINLNNNKISSLSGILNIKTENGVQTIEDRLAAKQIDMKNNQIQDVTPLSHLLKIEHLDLSSNKIADISSIERFSYEKGLDLRNQSIDMTIYKKSTGENQYIVLNNILQSGKNTSSKAYDNNAYFTTVGCELNNNELYQMAPYYNVIISPEKTSKDTISITLHNGIASGSTINYKISTSSSSIDSIIFEDQNLDKAIYEDLVERKKTRTYIARAPYIINISRDIITYTKELQLTPKKGYEIENLRGLSNFSNLEDLNLSDNHISDDSEIKFLTKLKVLNLANNRLNNNYTSIENLYLLTNINLIGNNINNLDSLNKYIDNTIAAKKKIALTNLSLSNNNIKDITVLTKLSTLTNVFLANNKIINLTPLQNNTGMKYLDISGNEVTDITVVSKFSTLESLIASNNIIRDINALSALTLSELDVSSNKISDISAIARHTSLLSLNIANNKIEDISSIEPLLIRNGIDAKQQKITRSISKNIEKNIEIELPPIFLAAKNTNSKIYTSSDFELDKCSLSEDGTKIIISPNEAKEGVAKIKIIDGQAANTTLSVAEMLESEIKYSNESKTNNDVKATISFNRDDVTILNNDGNKEYTFTQNGEFTFEYVDDDGFDGRNTATVDWIDKDNPEIITKEYNEVDGGIEVLITVNEPIQDINGWNFTDENKTSIKKIFTENTINETISIKDEVGNTINVELKYEKEITDPEPEKETIQSTVYTVQENEKIIQNIQPNEKISSIKNNITTNSESIKFFDKNNKELNNTNIIGTGATIVLSDNTKYTVVVKGDVNGDGKADIKDIVEINKHRLNKSKIEGVCYTAGNVDNNSKLDIKDILKVNKFRLNKIKEL